MGPTNRIKNKGAYQPQAFNVICLVKEIVDDFVENRSGLMADLAYYELVVQVERYLYGGFEEAKFKEYLEMVFGTEDFDTVFKKAEDNYNSFNAQLHGEEPVA